MLIFIKLGGSLITDKRESQHFQAHLMNSAAYEIAEVVSTQPELSLLIGHGSGSFGHIAAQQHGTADGVSTAEQWLGFAEVATIARRLNTLVVEVLYEAGLPIFTVQPSSSLQCKEGRILSMEVEPIRIALAHGLVPVVYGDVGIDQVRGGTIASTESIFAYLANQLHPDKIFLLGEVEGVFDAQQKLIPLISPKTIQTLDSALGASHGVDVTGGMESKVRQMVELVTALPTLEVHIMSGTVAGSIASALKGQPISGTRIANV